ncbi:hypothetical protein Pmani_039472 [Petrolisthes manimaculis]|uniref:Uncharacterized protein n=1 Tax=Petrolisthes manimaculis TaxID=1843537 RepID=A0AAE1NDR2_9EUCA|nr:hypothetical protein Pmani_039472 [Petrolisthes manimaculis]
MKWLEDIVNNTQPSSSPPTKSYTNTHTNTRKLDRRGEGAKISKQGRVTRPTAKRVAPPRPPQAKIPPTPRQNPSQSKMTMDDSKDSATSPIIAQSPPPQIGQQNSEGFNLKRAGERLIEAGDEEDPLSSRPEPDLLDATYTHNCVSYE